jgi:hypothetical protein
MFVNMFENIMWQKKKKLMLFYMKITVNHMSLFLNNNH